MEKSKIIFGNEIAPRDYKKAVKGMEKFRKKFGDDSGVEYRFVTRDNPVLAHMGVKDLVLTDGEGDVPVEKSLIVGNIRMGYGHYRISMAIASAAHALGYTPLWLDLNGYPASTATKIISSQNDLYSLGSRLSQKFSLFNKLVWEPINSEGFRKLTYNAGDQKTAELMEPLLRNLPKSIPYVATHAWPAQAAVHARFERVVNAIPDNWPMALHLAEGSIHTVQTPSAYLGYKALRGFDPKRNLSPMPAGSLYDVGHYVDHELVTNIPADCDARMERLTKGAPRRFLLTVGGAGAQKDLFVAITRHLLPRVKKGEAALFINAGDHRKVWEEIAREAGLDKGDYQEHFNDYADARAFIEKGEGLSGVQVFCNDEIFAAVYLTNLLMRVSDVILTKPSELSFYPVPKLMIHRVGGHEAWGAIRTAEVGDGTYEIDDTREALGMLDNLMDDKDFLTALCRGVRRAASHGVYDGAYKAVKLAVGEAIDD